MAAAVAAVAEAQRLHGTILNGLSTDCLSPSRPHCPVPARQGLQRVLPHTRIPTKHEWSHLQMNLVPNVIVTFPSVHFYGLELNSCLPCLVSFNSRLYVCIDVYARLHSSSGCWLQRGAPGDTYYHLHEVIWS